MCCFYMLCSSVRLHCFYLTSVLFSYVKHLLLLSLILGASIKVTNESKTTFGAVVDTGYLADNADYIFERFSVWPE